ncbi:MurR/RpiR family transcriptional regulator [Kribbella sp. CA-293567]|uniref:MurR/RpiR family transcriptional regulator n=1 Tax=Kribbella sp. CA-293567 TaxID=3002436 RepID=UPI0022DE8CB4|nr:MurR/RpiR family transcriptional regulator [Kribbella sp. CA-293567]WBQ03158.1 MurR/RpiR family transcriptional regulator [Kribbella sp. CA-293567]
MASSGPPPSSDVLRRLRESGDELQGALRTIADFVLAEPAAASRLTIVELAERTGTSPGTVTRFSRACGLHRYADLRVALAEEAGRSGAGRWSTDIGRQLHPDDSLDRVVEVLVSANTQALVATAERLDPVMVDQVAEAIVGARHCHFFGVGTSAVTAEEFGLRVRRIGVACWTWPDVHSALIAAAQADQRDVFVGISFSGHVAETVEVIDAAAARGTTTVVITQDRESPLARSAGLLLTTAPPSGNQQAQATADRHAQFLLVDIVYARIAQLTHPAIVEVLDRTAAAVDGHRIARRSRRGPRPS